MKWKYKDEWYGSFPYDWNIDMPVDYLNKILVYNPKWNKCFWLISLRYSGNGNKLKAYIEDVYSNKHYYVEAKTLEIVKKLNYEKIN